MSIFQPKLSYNFTSGTDDGQSAKEEVKNNLIEFLNVRCSEKPSLHFPGDANKISLSQRLYYILSSSIVNYIIETFIKNNRIGNTDVNSPSWKWKTQDIKIDDNTLSLAKKEYLTHYIYDKYGAKAMLSNKGGDARYMRKYDEKKLETSQFLKGIVDRLAAMAGFGAAGGKPKYDVMYNPDVSGVLRKNVVDGIADLIQKIAPGIAYSTKIGNQQKQEGYFNPYISGSEDTDVDFSDETYLSLASIVDGIIKNLEEMQKSIDTRDSEVKGSDLNYDKDNVHAAAEKIRIQNLDNSKKQIFDMILDLNSIEKAFKRRSIIDQDKNGKKAESEDKKSTKVTLPNTIMKAIYEQLPNFPFPVLSIDNESLRLQPGHQHSSVNVNGKTINLYYYYENGYINPSPKTKDMVGRGVIPWLKDWYGIVKQKINNGEKGDVYSENVPRSFAEKLLEFCVLNNAVFDFDANSVQYKRAEAKFDSKIQTEPGIVQDMDGNMFLELSKNTIYSILSNVTGDCKNRMIRYANSNFERVADRLGIFLFSKRF